MNYKRWMKLNRTRCRRPGNQTSIRPHNTRTEIYAGRIACCPLVSHVEYASTGQTDRRTPDAASVLNRKPTYLPVVFDVVSERDEARLELLRVESSRARLVEVQERPAELFQLLVADTLRIARQDLSTTSTLIECKLS